MLYGPVLGTCTPAGRRDFQAYFDEAVCSPLDGVRFGRLGGADVAVPRAVGVKQRLRGAPAPRQVVVCVKRWTPHGGGFVKNEQPLNVDLGAVYLRFAAPPVQGAVVDTWEVWCYRIDSVVTHPGQLAAGHYFVHTRDAAGWTLTNDETVHDVDEEAATLAGATAYLMLMTLERFEKSEPVDAAWTAARRRRALPAAEEERGGGTGDRGAGPAEKRLRTGGAATAKEDANPLRTAFLAAAGSLARSLGRALDDAAAREAPSKRARFCSSP